MEQEKVVPHRTGLMVFIISFRDKIPNLDLTIYERNTGIGGHLVLLPSTRYAYSSQHVGVFERSLMLAEGSRM